MKRLIPSCRRGISTVTSVFMLLLMFTALVTAFSAYFQYNLAMIDYVKIEQERSQEKILFTEMGLDNERVNILNITIANVGTIEVRIRAIYVEKDGIITLKLDPSTYMDTHIPPGEFLTINVEPAIPFEEANIIAATERGTKTIEYEPRLLYDKDGFKVSPHELTIGPVLLKFTDFFWRKTKNGALDPDDIWHPGWIIPSKTQCAWMVTVKNIDNRTISITLNNYTSFNTVTADGSANVLNWHLSVPSIDLPYNQTVNLIFMFEDWNSKKLVSIYSNECSCKIFLTCYGVFHWAGGKPDAPYAQTIPFEAIFVTK